MHYWNKANFESLSRLAELLLREPVLSHLGRYAQLRERGLKEAAKGEIQAFLLEAASGPVELQRQWAARILELRSEFPGAHQWPGSQVLRQFIAPVLQAWDSVEGRRYQALLHPDVVLLEAALREEDHPRLRQALVAQYLQSLEYASHHLSESRWIGDFAEARRDLDRLHVLAPELEAGRKLEQLLQDWQEFTRLKPSQSFPEWCQEKL